jgi:S-adenosylmethionine:tRNA ribosyltransferase-isomerase
MKAATRPRHASPDTRLLVIDAHGISHRHHSDFVSLLQPGDLMVANDAATLPASLAGVHEPSGQPIEVRLAARRSLAADDVRRFTSVIFGAGDFRTPTEHRPLPPTLAAGDELLLGPLRARVMDGPAKAGHHESALAHPRLVELRFEGPVQAIWEGLAHHGRPIQYAYIANPLAIWDTWTHIAGVPAAFEAPSAGFILNWSLLREMRRRGVRFATITHAAGISSTGDTDLDALLPLDEPYSIPRSTAALIAQTRADGGRVIAIGTTVVRALEDAAGDDGLVRSGAGVARHRIGPDTELRIVDAIVSGMHEPGTSHYELLKAFVDDEVLAMATTEAEERGYEAHEFGDAAFVERLRCLRADLKVGPYQMRTGRPDVGRYEIRTFRGNCELSSRNVFLRESSAAVGCTTPLASVARETIVCSPGVAPSHL